MRVWRPLISVNFTKCLSEESLEGYFADFVSSKLFIEKKSDFVSSCGFCCVSVCANNN